MLESSRWLSPALAAILVPEAPSRLCVRDLPSLETRFHLDGPPGCQAEQLVCGIGWTQSGLFVVAWHADGFSLELRAYCGASSTMQHSHSLYASLRELDLLELVMSPTQAALVVLWSTHLVGSPIDSAAVLVDLAADKLTRLRSPGPWYVEEDRWCYWAPSGEHFVILDHNSDASIFSASSGQELENTFRFAEWKLPTWSADGRQCTIRGGEACMQILDMQSSPPSRKSVQELAHVSFSPDGHVLVSLPWPMHALAHHWVAQGAATGFEQMNIDQCDEWLPESQLVFPSGFGCERSHWHPSIRSCSIYAAVERRMSSREGWLHGGGVSKHSRRSLRLAPH